MNKIIKAAQFAFNAHAKQFRDDGITPYYRGHIARILGRACAHPKATEDFCCVMALHDTIEDCGVVKTSLRLAFNEYVADGVWYLTSRSKQIEYECRLQGINYAKPPRGTRKLEDAIYLMSVPELMKIGKLIDRNENLNDTLIKADPKWALRYVNETLSLHDKALTGVDKDLETELLDLCSAIEKKYKDA